MEKEKKHWRAQRIWKLTCILIQSTAWYASQAKTESGTHGLQRDWCWNGAWEKSRCPACRAEPRLTISRLLVREHCCTHAENIPKMRHIHPPPVPLPTDCMPLEVGSDVSSWAGPAANPVGPWWMWWVEWSGPRHEACCAQRSQSRFNSPNDP